MRKITHATAALLLMATISTADASSSPRPAQGNGEKCLSIYVALHQAETRAEAFTQELTTVLRKLPGQTRVEEEVNAAQKRTVDLNSKLFAQYRQYARLRQYQEQLGCPNGGIGGPSNGGPSGG